MLSINRMKYLRLNFGGIDLELTDIVIVSVIDLNSAFTTTVHRWIIWIEAGEWNTRNDTQRSARWRDADCHSFRQEIAAIQIKETSAWILISCRQIPSNWPVILNARHCVISSHLICGYVSIVRLRTSHYGNNEPWFSVFTLMLTAKKLAKQKQVFTLLAGFIIRWIVFHVKLLPAELMVWLLVVLWPHIIQQLYII